jgi:hypothetical protein
MDSQFPPEQPPTIPGNAAPYLPAKKERPGCVTAYAVLLFIGAGILVLAGLIGGISLINYKPALGVIYIVGGLLFAIFYFFLGRGFWRLQNWARITIIVLQSLGIVVGLVELCYVFSMAGANISPVSIITLLISFGLGGYIIYWFSTHGDIFH